MNALLKKLSTSAMLLVMLFGGLSLMAGCETGKGIERDVENAGDKIEDATD
jgi:predicted small secreted protein